MYIYFYNNGNALGTCSGGCKTKFFFDDVELSACTTQPLPNDTSPRIKGELSLLYNDGTTQKLPFVKVWAYRKDDPQNTVYETFSIQNGEFNFYNLPATDEGVEYFIFAQYYLVDPLDPSQIEILAANTSVILRNSNDFDNPALTFLNLNTLTGP